MKWCTMQKLTGSVACDVLFIKMMHSKLGLFNENSSIFKVFYLYNQININNLN